ncbi:MAG: phosphate transport system regulatory protein PhoU [Desulfuromonas sp.]|nr:MAG: phosphate transport system regulatory protein PhoU [Desulfuromonas sp.]
MTVLMQKELDELKKMLLSLTAVVEGRVQQAIQALMNADSQLAEKVLAGDDEVDRMEVDLEEECLKVLALHQPVATDLRLIVSVLKMNNDLERIADLSVNIAQRAAELASDPTPAPYNLQQMADQIQTMLKMSLDSLVQQDSELARKTVRMDDVVDTQHKDNFNHVKAAIRAHPEQIDSLVLYLSISRYMERIADLATNIAEDVVYLIDGEIIRHHDLS